MSVHAEPTVSVQRAAQTDHPPSQDNDKWVLVAVSVSPGRLVSDCGGRDAVDMVPSVQRADMGSLLRLTDPGGRLSHHNVLPATLRLL